MVKNICVDEALKLPGVILVDVRSEGEFKEATIPGAVNVPLLNNEERVMVGAEYRQVSVGSAKRMGLDIISSKLPAMVRDFDDLTAQGRKVVLFCWRGGMRSQSVAHILDMMGFDVYRINGGYKDYRRYVSGYLEEKLTLRAVVIHGLTGVGKTLVLKGLAELGIPVLDLEGLAVHRGSVYGKVGLPPSPSQKLFESLIFRDLKAAEPRGLFLVECESRRLGRLSVPTSVLNAMKEGYGVLLYAPLETRVRRSLKEYVSDTGDNDSIDQILAATGLLKRYLGQKKVELLSRWITEGQIEEAVKLLLVEYYDPLYKYPDRTDSGYDLSVDTMDIDLAVDQIYRFVKCLPEYNLQVDGGERDGYRE